jgi:hypothetical protein
MLRNPDFVVKFGYGTGIANGKTSGFDGPEGVLKCILKRPLDLSPVFIYFSITPA